MIKQRLQQPNYLACKKSTLAKQCMLPFVHFIGNKSMQNNFGIWRAKIICQPWSQSDSSGNLYFNLTLVSSSNFLWEQDWTETIKGCSLMQTQSPLRSLKLSSVTDTTGFEGLACILKTRKK